MRLFEPANVVSVFRGFSDSGMEFHADLVLPYQEQLPAQAAPPDEVVGDRFQWARGVVRPALLDILGPEGSGWRTETRARPDKPGSSQTWVFLTETVEEIEHAVPPEEQNLLSRAGRGRFLAGR